MGERVSFPTTTGVRELPGKTRGMDRNHPAESLAQRGGTTHPLANVGPTLALILALRAWLGPRAGRTYGRKTTGGSVLPYVFGVNKNRLVETKPDLNSRFFFFENVS